MSAETFFDVPSYARDGVDAGMYERLRFDGERCPHVSHVELRQWRLDSLSCRPVDYRGKMALPHGILGPYQLQLFCISKRLVLPKIVTMSLAGGDGQSRT